MINKETYKDIGKAKENCFTDRAEFCYFTNSQLLSPFLYSFFTHGWKDINFQYN